MKKIIALLILIYTVIGNIAAQSPQYSFFTAGHCYGNPNSYHYGLHYPFVDYFPSINAYPNMAHGILTGDVVFSSTAPYWDSAQVDIAKLNMPIHLAAGNHDISAEFVNRFGNYYYSFKQNNDLFIVLTPGLDAWNISGNQLTFLTNTIDSNYLSVNNIFIFMHELVWWSPTNQYKNVLINYTPHYPGSSNFDSIVKPLLLSYPNNFIIYAGDLGATTVVSSLMYDRFSNITLIGSGMGSGNKDNIIITDVYQDSVRFKLIALNGSNIHALGEIESYSINSISNIPTKNAIKIYPNAVEDYFKIENNSPNTLSMTLIDSNGQVVHHGVVENNTTTKFDVAALQLNSGVYIIQLFDDNYHSEHKIVVHSRK